MSGTTVIRRADWVVAWSEEKSSHVYLRDADVVFQGTEVLSIGEHYDGEVETEIDGGRVVISARAETDESVCIQVEDNGIGIAAHDIKKPSNLSAKFNRNRTARMRAPASVSHSQEA